MTLRRGLALLAMASVALLTGAAWRPTTSYSAPLAPSSQLGRTTWLSDCAVCHGSRAGGTDRGPSIDHSGTAAVDFMVRTGRMPLADPDEKMQRREPKYDDATIRALVTYVGRFIDGPAAGGPKPGPTNLPRGGSIYLAQCAACHQSAGAGGALANGNTAPSLYVASAREIREAIRTGPGNMPRFANGTLDDSQVADVTAYVRHLRDPGDRGGFDLGHLGPVPEGLVAVAGGLGFLVLVLRWLGTSAADDDENTRAEHT